MSEYFPAFQKHWMVIFRFFVLGYHEQKSLCYTIKDNCNIFYKSLIICMDNLLYFHSVTTWNFSNQLLWWPHCEKKARYEIEIGMKKLTGQQFWIKKAAGWIDFLSINVHTNYNLVIITKIGSNRKSKWYLTLIKYLKNQSIDFQFLRMIG